MRIGELRYRVTIQEPALSADGSGGFTQAWQDIAEDPEVFAAISPLGAGERFRHRQVTATATHRIVMRYRSDVTANMRVVRGSVVYDIISVTEREGRYLDIVARAEAP